MKIAGLPPDTGNYDTETKLKLLNAAGAVPRAPVARAEAEATEKKSAQTDKVELSTEAQIEVSKLKALERQARQHEQAHISASNGLNVSSASYTYQRGPNGINYAVSGEVKIDTSPGRTPQDTLAKAELIRDVALAPADPSAVDRSVAAKAQNMAMQARLDIMHAENNTAIHQKYENSTAPAAKSIDTFA